MDIFPHPPEPTDTEQHRADNHRRMLDRLAALGLEMAEAVVADVKAGADRVEGTVMYDRISRSVRRSILLCQQVGAVSCQRPLDDRIRFVKRANVVRQVEDAIQSEVAGEAAERLERELHERLDAPEFEDELATRPVEHLIEEICHDLGLHDPGNQRLWKRRVPRDLRALWERAAAKCRVHAVAGGDEAGGGLGGLKPTLPADLWEVPDG